MNTDSTDNNNNNNNNNNNSNNNNNIVPIAIETGGAWNELALEFITELGRRMSGVTHEPRETQFLF